MKSISLFKGLSLLVGLNFLVKPVWIFFIDRQIQNTVGHEVYGSYFSVLNLSIVLSFVADAGLTNMVNQRVASGESFAFNQIIRIKLVLSLIYVLAVCCIAAWSGLTLWSIILPVVFIQILTSFFVLLRNIITAHQYFTADAWLSVIDKTLMILILGSFLYLPLTQKVDLYFFLYIQIACTLLSTFIASLVLFRKKISAIIGNINLKQVLVSTAPFTLIILLMGMHTRLDGFLLERIHPNGAYEAGVYAASFRLLDTGNMLGYLAASFIVPFVAKHSGNNALIGETILTIRHVLLFIGAGIVSFVLVFAPDLQQFLYHSLNEHSIAVMQWCIASLPAYYFLHIYGSVLTATIQFRPFIVVLIGSVIINLVINLVFIPTYGAVACCVAALISQSFCGLALYIIASRKMQLTFSISTLLIYLLTAVGLYFLFRIGKNYSWNVWLLLSTAALLTLLMMFAQIAYFRKLFISYR
jgi:O-antigen/teichoic acid export membrane protein